MPPLDRLDFGRAISAMHRRQRVAREGWNGKGMYLLLVQPPPVDIAMASDVWLHPTPNVGAAVEVAMFPDCRRITVALPPTMVMRTADGSFVAWLASQTDALARDWRILDPQEPV